MKRYSAFAIAREAMRHHTGWNRAWRDAQPKPKYDVIIVGAGGHGLATAYYLGKNFGITNVAILEKGWLGGGNTGRNTTIIRSNYLQDPSAAIYEKSRSLYETMSQDLNYNVMFSPRGLIMLAQTHHEVRGYQRTAHANALQGVSTEFISPARVKELVPIINIDGPRYPVLGGLYQARGGTARHDAVAWGYARACSDMGMDVIQQCEVTAVRTEGGKVTGVDTTRGPIDCDKLGGVVAGHSGHLCDMAGFRLPIESVALQALVSEPIKPCMDVVVMANTVHGYMSQSDKGEMVIGGGTDGYNNYTQRGSFHHIEETVRALIETFPMVSRLKMLRQWGGIVDVTGDRSPILSKTPVEGMFINCGWGTGGFKAIPGSGWAMAELMAKGHSPLTDEFSMHRFREGKFIDESVAAGVAH
ncbi:sarcosine oxidase subunit beta family protein [Sulfitobacter pseudonitzschiae]|uniref:Sarcosine oxidase subunit beta n=1 Tax=Pseudosulfitobacter pseudonitzschiae TaxID=1402135 RepID=A0A9Q2NTG3_9RHOB|nr:MULTISPECIES: sarcosine oxidase subunit beta family protein [Roseobacteraceae]MBM2292174.1 sarcosine oxidase subunit beta family protein [Pseudosulfitobacter pseudonitzschiae]MBM2297092.1 sarcosine oxidase subunit beta family protein [Pseudosulfitobacter pseudonitzschiae]MBM2302006.1 sarcosine oxidase subunit beta family protein [Pseudosulfitobacter pseudonitzschiae]MBM2311788.1 sarcosine oxidase subunit beta family protein [Pseudosulfitobacter pseudonitzschiae]MBM2316702.1 sarcosine oxidas|tara:strand:+ start:469 stop:1713 length:1245 start_codon:yes stop_codon:yes gene_type:complete